MRMDLPQCNLKTCIYQTDGNCVNVNKYSECGYIFIKNTLRRTITEINEKGCVENE